MTRLTDVLRRLATPAARPRLLVGLVRLLMVVTLVTVLTASLYLQSVFDNLRASTRATIEDVFAARDVQATLCRALAAERGARLARTDAEFQRALAHFDAASREIADQLRPAADRQAPGRSVLLETSSDFRAAVPAALAALRRSIPARPGVLAVASGDDAVVERANDLVSRFVTDAMALRQRNIGRLVGRERVDIAVPLGVLTLFVVLLGGSATRMVEGSQRLHVARSSATEQAELLRGVVDHMRDGVAVFDADDRLVLCNGRLASVTGLPESLTRAGTPYRAVADALARAEPPLLDQPRPAPSRPVSGEMRLGDRVLAVYRSAMPFGGQMLTACDVTERIANEELVRRAQRMDVLGRLTGGVAHDFNNLLQALSANLEVLAVAVAPTGEPRLSDLTCQALAAVERGTRLTRHLLAFARRQELASVAIDTTATLASLRDLLTRTLGDAIEVRLSLQPGLWPVFADPSGLENALLNLALNGRDAMPNGGRLSISASNERTEEGDRVRIEMVDDGVGMTRDQIARAVEPFYTTKSVGAGVGLGLSLVDGFARQSGGRFRLESELGRGTHAILDMPRASAGPVANEAVASVERGSGETVLLVEDDPVVCRAAREALEQLGYRVVEAADALSACRRLEEDRLRPDLMFTDVMMPGPLDVADLARRARALMPNLPILFNTGDVEARVLSGVVFDERTLLVVKPWRLAEMSHQLRILLDRSAPALLASDPA